jgi:hypothetical protein
MASPRSFQGKSKSKKMLEELDAPVAPAEETPVAELTSDTPYIDRSAAELLAQLAQAQTAQPPVPATVGVGPEMSMPTSIEELLAAQGPNPAGDDWPSAWCDASGSRRHCSAVPSGRVSRPAGDELYRGSESTVL